jgi:SOS-response transcriptional repressor LexA
MEKWAMRGAAMTAADDLRVARKRLDDMLLGDVAVSQAIEALIDAKINSRVPVQNRVAAISVIHAAAEIQHRLKEIK